ncbi:ABC transporter substrate-binding protein [Lysobacter sp. K5869]|uniref:ABC transporter substrate-binding protein n=1 Tax=Lysobacter sp. K5869 TaxID=2820808 RepID=UPI001C063D99|nr:ABC transporter substrate-binding protein [Lysobacter sp. K5869]QWP78729.1 ABC transporter substrate-binding protein [Lysobacter sp. K5869]
MKALRYAALAALFLIASLGMLYLAPAQARPKQNERISVFAPRLPKQGLLVLHGSSNAGLMRALILDYQRLHPGVEVRYSHLDTQELYDRALRAGNGPERADLILSASTDLQVKLVNDGYARAHRSPQGQALPAAARWRDEVFAYGYEPVAMVYHSGRLDPAQAPRDRDTLLRLLRRADQPLRGRIALQDPRDSAVAYFIATQDSKQLGNGAAPLLAALGAQRAQPYKRMDALLDRLSEGELSLAYGVFGSYALQRIERGAPLRLVLPRDHLLLVARTALIPRDAPHADEARRFLDHLLSPRGQTLLAREAYLIPARPELPPPAAYRGLLGAAANPRRVPLGLGLLVYLDETKRRHFLRDWGAALGTGAAQPGASRR